MIWYQIFRDGPEYETRKAKLRAKSGLASMPPEDLSLRDVREAVSPRLFERSTSRSLVYIIRHLLITWIFYWAATQIEGVAEWAALRTTNGTAQRRVATGQAAVQAMLWVLYWGWQGVAFAGIWCLGHEAGHAALSPHRWVNAVIGMSLHTFVLTPYYAWRATHRRHHKATNNIELDETYLPPLRADFKLPDGKIAVRMDYKEVLEETPGYTLFKLFVRQFFGFQLYLIHNRKGNRRYPPRTSHYKPSSMLFRQDQRNSIIVSNIAIGTMVSLLALLVRATSWTDVCKYYFMPWLLAHNWIVMFTYLQHSDPTIPYYRRDQWTFARGCLATVDRPLFGWVGRFFFHNISTDHVAHHFFSSIPFYNLPEVTEAIKPVLGEYYNYDSTPVLYALWRSFTQCTFIENEGDILFFKNQYGESVVEMKDVIS